MFPSINLVMVGYTREKTLESIRWCDRHFKQEFFPIRLLVVNRAEIVEAAEVPNWTLIEGTNLFAEFSGWQEGLDRLVALKRAENATLFVNDTLVTHRRFSLARRWSLLKEIFRAAPRSIVGFVHHSDNDIGDLRIAGLELPGWVSTFCFMLGSEALKRLNYRLYEPEVLDRCVPGLADESAFVSDQLSPDLQLQIRRWLFQGGWYRSEPLSEANAGMFTVKAKLICAEWLLSARCWHAGCARHDPFERHPFSAWLDWKSEDLVRRFRLGRGMWAEHPENWRGTR